MSKTYQKTNKGKGNFFKRNIYAILLGFAVIVIAAIVTVTLIISARTNLPPGEIDPDYPIYNPQDPQWVMPVANVNIGQAASLNSLIWCRTLRQWRTHNGVDFLGTDSTHVYAPKDGRVTSVQNTILHGTVVTIDHGNGLISQSKSLANNVPVQEGQDVKGGDRIGTMSDSKIVNAHQGAHLHLQIRQSGNLIDPMTVLPNGDK